MEPIIDTKGDIYAYEYKGVKIRVHNTTFSVSKAALGFPLFDDRVNHFWFDTIREAKWFIDDNLWSKE